MLPNPPPKLSDLRAGHTFVAGLGRSTVIADIDFETYSPAGFIWNNALGRFEAPVGAPKKGLPGVGVAVYAEHPDTEVLSCAYDLKDGHGVRLWLSDMNMPVDLANHVRHGGLLEAWNASFEAWIWERVCVPKYQWLPIQPEQWRCAMAKARAFALPGSLAATGDILATSIRKDRQGKRLLDLFSIPRKPTKRDARKRITPAEAPANAEMLYEYNRIDIRTEAEISSRIPDLIPSELEFWLCDQRINRRGVQMDVEHVQKALTIVQQALPRYNWKLAEITDGQVKSASQIQAFRNWLLSRGVVTESLDSDAVTRLLASDTLPDDCRQALDVRNMIGSSAVKKLYAMTNTSTREGRIHDLFIYHSARTGRAAGTGAQPQNLPNSGINVTRCDSDDCTRFYSVDLRACPWCGRNANGKILEWCPEAVTDALETIATGNLDCVEYFWGSAIAVISSCLRGMFIARPGHDLICSDYSAIEAVVLAALAGENWRLDVFRTHGKIYEMSASKITGIPFDEFELYKATSGQHHPMRKKVGKVSELASGFGGWLGAWKQFGADEFFSDDEIKDAILAWRDASPAIVAMWGGQPNWRRNEYYGLEGAAIRAVMFPGETFSHRMITYRMIGGVLYCTLPSGRHITYHRPLLSMSQRREGTYELSFEGWNTNPKNGAMGWIRMSTYGGKLTENVVQAVARDILANAIVNLERAGYPIVLHVHDEIVAEVPEGFGSVAEFERIMSTLPEWANDWPVKASGGWRAKRYAK